jgi:hypothetical protein
MALSAEDTFMCTVSVVQLPDRLRVVCNRDESHDRAPAIPPRVTLVGDVRVAMPIDPESGGTWVAVNDVGLAFALLNVNSRTRAHTAQAVRSRGEILPRLLGCRSVGDVARAAATIDPCAYRPFRIVAVSVDGVVEIAPGVRAACYHSSSTPLMFTSSGLGDHYVDGPRRALFDRLVRPGGDLADRQDRFHAHAWRARPHLSVRMTRDDAMTVSRTTVEVLPGRIMLTYSPEPFERSWFAEIPRADSGAPVAAVRRVSG